MKKRKCKPTILVVCPGARDYRELEFTKCTEKYNILFHEYDGSVVENILCHGIGSLSKKFCPDKVISHLSKICVEHSVDGVFSTEDYPGSIFASIISHTFGLSGPSPDAVLQCQHKYYCRKVQQACVPEATPQFYCTNTRTFSNNQFPLSFPVFTKPIKSFFSFFANKVHSHDQLEHYIAQSCLPEEFLSQFGWFMKNYSTCGFDDNDILIEQYLPGFQVTLDGYVYNNQVVTLGVIDSIMFPDTICFKRFEYPSSLPLEVQERMADIAQRIMTGLGFNNGIFNIEFMYDQKTGDIKIIEVNPRMASQAADMYEKVDGINLYEIACALALGHEPCIKKNKGKHAIAASFVQRVFEDRYVCSIPSEKQKEIVLNTFPDCRLQIYVKEGQKLSDVFQDGKSYRYGLIHLGGKNKKDLLDNYEWTKQQLEFAFKKLL